MKVFFPITFLIALFVLNNCKAQVSITDSLILILKTTKGDTNKVNVLNGLSYAYRNIQADTGLLYGQQALLIAEHLQWKRGMGKAFKCIGNNYYSLTDPDKSLASYEKALKIFQQIKDRAAIAEVLMNIGTVHQFFLSDYLLSMKYYDSSLKIFQQMHNKSGIAKNYSNLAIIYETMGDYPKALETFQLALKQYEELGDKEGMAKTLGNLGIFYNDMHENKKALDYCNRSSKLFLELEDKYGMAANYLAMGNIYLDLLDFPNSLRHYNKSIEMFDQIGEKVGIAKSLGNIGMLYANSARFVLARDYFTKSFLLNKEIGNKSGMANVLWNMGDVYLNAPDSAIEEMGYHANKKYELAEESLTKSLKISKDIGEPDQQEIALQKLSEVYEKQHKYSMAHQAYKNYISVRDSILNDAKKKEIAQKEIAYVYDKKEALLKAQHEKDNELSIAEVSRQRAIRNYLVGGISVAAILSLLLIWSYNRRRQLALDKEVSEIEMKALRSQMNPHFIFNCLQSINKYVLENDKTNASEYLSKFAKLMRLTLENSREREVPLGQDLSALELYIQLEALRFQDRFNYKIEVDECIDAENTLIPPLMLQPFVENSILHGIQQREKGLVTIKINKQGNMIRCVVEDNGIGRVRLPKLNGTERKYESLGMKITQERLQIINQLKKTRSSINIFDITDDQGLRIELLLPFEMAF